MKLTPEAKVALIEYARTHPCTPRAQIAAHYGVSRQRVEQILGRAGVATKYRPQRVSFACMECGKVNSAPPYAAALHGKKLPFCNRQCRYNYTHPQVACAWCGKLFRRGQSQLKFDRGYRSLHCSRSCLSLHYWSQRRAAGLRGLAGRLPAETSLPLGLDNVPAKV